MAVMVTTPINCRTDDLNELSFASSKVASLGGRTIRTFPGDLDVPLPEDA